MDENANMTYLRTTVRSVLARNVAFLLLCGLLTSGALADTLTGQIVCSQCWFEADRETTPYGGPADLDCAADCARRGIGPALAVRGEEGFLLYGLEGRPPGGGKWLEWIGRFVRAEGAVEIDNDEARLRPGSLQTLESSPWPETAERGAHENGAELVWTDLRGGKTGLHQRRDRIVVVNFWATWCRPCIKEMPDLIELHDKYAPYGVEFIGAAADDAEHGDTVLDFAREHRINFPVVLGATTTQMQGLGLPPVLPATVVFDEQGHAAELFAGVIRPERLDAALSRLLGLTPDKGKRVARAGTHAHDHATHAALVPS